MHEVLDPWLNPVTWVVPFFLLFIGIEFAALKWLDHDDGVTGYQARDASTSILMGLFSLASTLALKVVAFFVYIALFVHTETVGKLPRPVEFVFNTPSHHRVHHGSDPIYLDRNYAGILMVWDRLFGTLQPELFRPKYGLTHPVGSYNLVEVQYGHYADLWRDVRRRLVAGPPRLPLHAARLAAGDEGEFVAEVG
jgi:hypothetical protein